MVLEVACEEVTQHSYESVLILRIPSEVLGEHICFAGTGGRCEVARALPNGIQA